MRRAVLVLVGVLAVASCSSTHTAVDNKIVARDETIALPLGDYGPAAWLRANEIVIERHASSDGPPKFELVRADADGRNASVINAAKDADCLLDQIRQPQRLPDGRLGASRSCEPDTDIPTDARNSIVVVDPATGAHTPLAQTGNTLTLQSAWNKELTSAIAMTIGHCGALVRVTTSGVEAIDLQVGPPAHRWNLADQFHEPKATNCAPYGTAGPPSADPTGTRVAFAALPDANDSETKSEPRAGEIEVWDLRANTTSVLVHKVTNVTTLAWSPTGRWIGFSGKPGDSASGLWLIDVQSKRLVRVSSDREVSAVTWSPDGQHLLYTSIDAANSTDPVLMKTSVHRVDLAPGAA